MLNLIKRILPSSRPKHDPAAIAGDCQWPQLRPIPITRIQLTWPMARQIISQRRIPLRPLRDKARKLTVIVPFRDRYDNLKEFAPAIAEHLGNQGIDHEILIVEQEFGRPFNKCMMMNAGVLEARADSDYFCFHDVDTVPLPQTDYSYCSLPLRPFGTIEAQHDIDWMLWEGGQVFSHYFGGAIIVPRDTFKAINGFSNEYWHWGSEDDDFLLRFLLGGIAPVYDPTGGMRLLYHPKTMFRNFDGTYSEDAAQRKMLAELTRQNTLRYRRFRRGLVDNSSGLSSCDYKVLQSREEFGCKIITISV